MSLLVVDRLVKSFDGVHAVKDIGFCVESGEMLAMIGPNGAGKSTCFNMINGQLRPDSGRILLRGENIAGFSARKIWARGVGRTFQIAAVFGSMTVRKNVEMALIAHAGQTFRFMRPAARRIHAEADSLLAQVGMADQANRHCGALAYGDVKRVELALALASRPQLLLMDEPTAGMAPQERKALMSLTRDVVREKGVSVLFTEHSMDVVFGYADRLLVLARGKLIADGPPLDVRNDPAVRAAYFGAGRSQPLVQSDSSFDL